MRGVKAKELADLQARRKVAEHPGLEHLESICLRVISGPMVRENACRRTCEKVHGGSLPEILRERFKIMTGRGC